ncbi:MAG: type VI secretion system protein TssA, partial [Gammaproteobacteria bacterium]|nr:type VI secretion system protein TssA [Gammaproteobacteria bacterium]
VAKQEGITPLPVNWEQVLNLSKIVLETKSKDIMMASYLCFALFDRKSYAGLASGLKACTALVKNYWEDIYPEKKRMRGRIAAITWLAEKLERAMEQRRPDTGDGPVLAESIATLEELDKFLTEQLASESPDLNKLLRLLRDFARDSERAATAAVAAPAATAATSEAAGPSVVATEQDLPKALRQCQATVRSAAGFIRSQKLEDPRSYRLTRIGAWLMIDQMPMQTNGVTQLTAVPTAVTQKYAAYAAEQKHAVLIPEVEESFSKSPFWLDAHRLTANALEALGASHAQARQTVINELALFLRRLPGLANLKYSDGTPFANDQTRLWIEQEVTAAKDSGSRSGTMNLAAAGEEAPWVVAHNEAKQLAAKGKMDEALTVFHNGYAQSSAQRARFCWGLVQARFCLDAGLAHVALPQLEYLDQMSTRFALEEWEPALSLEVARVLLVCYAQTAEKNKKLKDALTSKAEQLYARICRLDLNAALQMELKVFQQQTV